MVFASCELPLTCWSIFQVFKKKKVSYTLVVVPHTTSLAGPLFMLLLRPCSQPKLFLLLLPAPFGSLISPKEAFLSACPASRLPHSGSIVPSLSWMRSRAYLYLYHGSYRFEFILFSALKVSGMCLSLHVGRSSWVFCHSSNMVT